jgi:elongator complex protein 3
VYRPELVSIPSGIVRELHVYGQLVPVGQRQDGATQHHGYGKTLLAEAERISRETYGLKKLLVISALGTRRYYMRQGYVHDGVYVSKKLE